METEDLATGSQLPRRPRNRTTLSGDFRHRIATGGAEMDDAERVDLTVNRELGDWRVNGFTSPGAVAALGLTYRF